MNIPSIHTLYNTDTHTLIVDRERKDYYKEDNSESTDLKLRLTCFISCGVYSMVRIIMTRSSKSRGIPCGEVMSSVPLESHK